MKKYSLLLMFMAFIQLLSAQGIDGLMRGNQKFPVVISVLVIILIGILFFLFSMEKRLKKLEDKVSTK